MPKWTHPKDVGCKFAIVSPARSSVMTDLVGKADDDATTLCALGSHSLDIAN
ncbi:hypothetical protein SLEP1_g25633 [Rubroshorea leprosula]|uniref:Uncharacterized protein n=1 Tax=Rubroshorea leprosula TaxID=152421 RepID=A0AAV5JTX1_9ROSI|nr:hypothetical protein SLEP1_g25633 [Rubroshorea leprosula]